MMGLGGALIIVLLSFIIFSQWFAGRTRTNLAIEPASRKRHSKAYAAVSAVEDLSTTDDEGLLDQTPVDDPATGAARRAAKAARAATSPTATSANTAAVIGTLAPLIAATEDTREEADAPPPSATLQGARPAPPKPHVYCD